MVFTAVEGVLRGCGSIFTVVDGKRKVRFA